MQRVKIRARLGDGRDVEALSNLSDAVAWERECVARTAAGDPWSVSVVDNPNTWQTWLAWRVLSRSGHIDYDYAAFLESAESLDIVTLDAPDPTQPEASTGP